LQDGMESALDKLIHLRRHAGRVELRERFAAHDAGLLVGAQLVISVSNLGFA
jgi:hypothetical protein